MRVATWVRLSYPAYGASRYQPRFAHSNPGVSQILEVARKCAVPVIPACKFLIVKRSVCHGRFCSLPTKPPALICALSRAVPLRSWCRILRMMFADQSAARLTALPAKNRGLICTHHCCSSAAPDGAYVRCSHAGSRHRSHRCGGAACSLRAAHAAAAVRTMSVTAADPVTARRRP